MKNKKQSAGCLNSLLHPFFVFMLFSFSLSLTHSLFVIFSSVRRSYSLSLRFTSDENDPDKCTQMLLFSFGAKSVIWNNVFSLLSFCAKSLWILNPASSNRSGRRNHDGKCFYVVSLRTCVQKRRSTTIEMNTIRISLKLIYILFACMHRRSR